MQGRNSRLIPFALFLLGAAVTAQGQAASDVDPQALAALKKMGAYLRTLNAFQVEALTTDEDVLDSGQKIEYSGKTTTLAHFPARLRTEVNNDRHQRLYLYDGKTFTLFAQRLNYYASMPAPATIAQLVDKMDEAYDLSVPLEDLFKWGTSASDTDAIKSAIVVGPSVVDDTTCEQFAFHQDDVDWQVWIQRGDYPLPRRVVITTNTDDAKPQHTATFTWNLAPSFNDDAFVFNPPEGASRVAFPSKEALVSTDKPGASAAPKKKP